MKPKLLLAFLLYVAGIIKIIDWFIFCYQNEAFSIDSQGLHEQYIARFPESVRPLFDGYPEPATVITILFFGIAGIIFFKEESVSLRIIGISAFFFAFWNMFSLM